ncbi:hypothetical protein [Undibacterium sp. RuTC16W]|uniref:hypothetical protein n=1 Tax=Undibacterium sp. RuTC16W TaxID=3413048 RepID=UPI003BF39511
MYEQIFRNLPGNPNWEGSFYETLTEYGNWSVDEFWKLHLDLIETAKIGGSAVVISRELAWGVVTLYSKIFNLISAHYNMNDSFQIKNLAPDELIAFTERFQHAMLGVFSGEVLPESSYDLINPLIVNV